MADFPDWIAPPPFLVPILGGVAATWLVISLIVQRTLLIWREQRREITKTELELRVLEAETDAKIKRLRETEENA